jgi:hypothetical protein
MIRMRMNRPIATSTIDSRNGIRQPQDMNCASVVSASMARNVTVASSRPAGTPNCTQAP